MSQSNGSPHHSAAPERRSWYYPLRRFIGHRPPGGKIPEPIPPLRWLKGVPMQYEVWASGFIGSVVGLLLVVSIMSTSTVFHDVFRAPIVISSFGATATLLFGVFDSPLSQPRNLVGGHIVSCVIAVAITRLFALNEDYLTNLTTQSFHPKTFVNAFITMPICLLAMFITHTVHPPAGAVALGACTDPTIVVISWAYIPVIIVSVLVMLAWALIINNLGRRRYPKHWWSEKGFIWPDWMVHAAQKEHRVRVDVEQAVEVKPVVEAQERSVPTLVDRQPS